MLETYMDYVETKVVDIIRKFHHEWNMNILGVPKKDISNI